MQNFIKQVTIVLYQVLGLMSVHIFYHRVDENCKGGKYYFLVIYKLNMYSLKYYIDYKN